MKWYEKIIAAHTTVTSEVSHMEKLKSERYFVWYESDCTDLVADGRHVATSVNGYTDLYTKTEFDSWVGELGAAFDTYGIGWELSDVDYEEDTGFFHYTWEWSVKNG